MPDLTLFHDPTSEPSRAVHWFALEAEIDLELELVWLTRGDHRSPDFLKINPAHQVPVLKHGEFCLPEASAIMLYLTELAACTQSWIGGSATEKANTHRFMSWHHSNTRKSITLDYALPVLLMPAYKGGATPGADEVEQLKGNIRISLALLEHFLDECGGFLGGTIPSIADLFIASDVFVLDVDPARDDLLEPFPGVQHWLDSLRKRPACMVSLAAWSAVTPRIRELLTSRDQTPRDPAWVAKYCLPYI